MTTELLVSCNLNTSSREIIEQREEEEEKKHNSSTLYRCVCVNTLIMFPLFFLVFHEFVELRLNTNKLTLVVDFKHIVSYSRRTHTRRTIPTDLNSSAVGSIQILRRISCLRVKFHPLNQRTALQNKWQNREQTIYAQ